MSLHYSLTHSLTHSLTLSSADSICCIVLREIPFSVLLVCSCTSCMPFSGIQLRKRMSSSHLLNIPDIHYVRKVPATIGPITCVPTLTHVTHSCTHCTSCMPHFSGIQLRKRIKLLFTPPKLIILTSITSGRYLQPLVLSLACPLSLMHSLTHALTHSLAHSDSLAHSLTYSLAHLHTQSLAAVTASNSL